MLRAQGRSELAAVQDAGTILGLFAIRHADYVPQNALTLEDAGKAYLKVDRELFGGYFFPLLVSEFTRRGMFDDASVANWLAHERALPGIALPAAASDRGIAQWLTAQLDRLGVSPGFGLAVQSVIRDVALGQTIVRVQLTEGRDRKARLLDNHGILVFRGDGGLADFHAPEPPAPSSEAGSMEARAAATRNLLERARQGGLDRHGVPVAIVRGADGRFTAEARVLHGDRFRSFVTTYTLERPEGETREITVSEP